MLHPFHKLLISLPEFFIFVWGVFERIHTETKDDVREIVSPSLCAVLSADQGIGG